MDSNAGSNLHAEVTETKTSRNKGIIFILFLIGVLLLIAGAYYLGANRYLIR